MKIWTADGYIPLNEFLDILEKNDFRRDATGTDLPSKEEPSPACPDFPKTDLETSNLLSCLDIDRLETVVSQWLAAGYVTSAQYQLLMQHLTGLVQASDRLRQVIHQIRVDRLHQEALAKVAKR